jgi:hypothetical protein
MRPFHFTRRPVSGGGCICLRLLQKSCQFAHRYVDGMVKHRKRIRDSIDMLMRISVKAEVIV